MSVRIITHTREETLKAMDTPGVQQIEIVPSADSGDVSTEGLGLAAVVADASGRLWRVDQNFLTLVSNWKRS